MTRNIKKMVLSSVFIAIGLVLPGVFHLLGQAGTVFLPMHLPVLLAGFLLGGHYGFVVGSLTPILSSFLTGMPPLFPVLPFMIIELAMYGWLAGTFNHNCKWSFWPTLAISLVGGRLVAAVAAWLAIQFLGFKMDPWVYVTGAVAVGLPGIILQIVVLPFLVRQLKHFNFK